MMKHLDAEGVFSIIRAAFEWDMIFIKDPDLLFEIFDFTVLYQRFH